MLKLNMQEVMCNVTEYEERKLSESKSKPLLPLNIQTTFPLPFEAKKDDCVIIL